MRSIIEVSAYVIIITIMCYLGIDYVRMNMQVMDMNEAVRYVENYIEINATMDNTYEIDQKTLSEVNAYMEKRGLIPEFVYEGDTDDYSYFKMITDYNMGSLFFITKINIPIKELYAYLKWRVYEKCDNDRGIKLKYNLVYICKQHCDK